jgi:hypothetical protein
MSPRVLEQSLNDCSSLLHHYRVLRGGRPVATPLATQMLRLHSAVDAIANDPVLNAEVVKARNAHGTGRFQFGTCHKIFQTLGRSRVLWSDEEAILQPHGIDRRELVRARRRSEKTLSRKRSDEVHALAGNTPLETLLSELHTHRVVEIGRGQRKLGKEQRRERRRLTEADYRRLQAAVFLLADTAALDSAEHVYPLSYALAVAGACV